MAVSLHKAGVVQGFGAELTIMATPTEVGTLFGTPASFAATIGSMVADQEGVLQAEIDAALDAEADFWSTPLAVTFQVPLV